MSQDDAAALDLFRGPKEVAQWAHREIHDAARAFALRVRELSDIAAESATEKIDLKQAEARHDLYYDRWGDALPIAKENPSDVEIYTALDQEVQRHTTRLATRKGSSRGIS